MSSVFWHFMNLMHKKKQLQFVDPVIIQERQIIRRSPQQCAETEGHQVSTRNSLRH